MAFSGTQVTRLGAIAVPRSLYGSFAGKTEETFVAPSKNNSMLAALNVRRSMRRLRGRR